MYMTQKKMNVKNVTFHGEVQDAVKFMNEYEIMIVPLLSGSGMRVKILEGMALGKGIVSTSIGKEGIHAKDNKHLMVSDSPIDFTDSIESLLLSQKKLGKMGKKARKFVEKNFENKEVAENLFNEFRNLLESSQKITINKPKLDFTESN